MTVNSSDFDLRSRDGRKLQVRVVGSADDCPVFLLHGSPGSRCGPHPRGIVLHRLGTRLISYDRPGYGQSDRAEGRTVADAAEDVIAIADALRIENFAVVGRSAGGPHALAVAALYPDRVSSAAVLVSLAPFDASGLDWYGNMAVHNVREFRAADGRADPHFDQLVGWAEATRRNPRHMIDMLEDDLSDSDQRVVGDVAMRRLLFESYAEGLRQGPGGWIDDILAIRRPWGFSLSAIRTRTLFWHGADDRFSPVKHAFWLHRQLRAGQAELHIQQGVGHFGAFEALPAVLSWVIDGVSSFERPTSFSTAFSRTREVARGAQWPSTLAAASHGLRG